MAVVLDATVGGANANSFTTVAYADAYHENQLYSDAWTTAPPNGPDATKKAKALITATQLIVNAINASAWTGWPASMTQRLPVPRSGMIYPSGASIPNTVIPTQLQDATAEYAKRLIEDGALPDSVSDTEAQSVGLKRFKAGSIEFEFDHEHGGAGGVDLPDAVYAMISFMFARGSSSSTIPLVRT